MIAIAIVTVTITTTVTVPGIVTAIIIGTAILIVLGIIEPPAPSSRSLHLGEAESGDGEGEEGDPGGLSLGREQYSIV